MYMYIYIYIYIYICANLQVKQSVTHEERSLPIFVWSVVKAKMAASSTRLS